MDDPNSPYITNIDTTLIAIKNRIRRLNHRCPYNNKRLTRRTENTLNQAEVMQNTVKERMASETNEEKSKQYAKILRELADYIQPEQTIDEQLQDLRQNKESMGIMKFDWELDCQDTFLNQFTLIIAPSKSGKSFLINQLCYEIPHSFDKICFFMGKVSYENKCPQVLKHVANRAGIKTQWINTDSEVKPEFTDSEDLAYKQLNPDGSSVAIYNDTTYPSIYIFDDLYTKQNDHWVVNFMDTMACMSRHRKTSCFIAFQGFSRLSNKIIDNATRIFLFYDILGREDLWRKMKIPPPTNLSEILRDIQMGMHTRWYYLDDDSLVEYVPYELSSKQQAINKMRSKLPRAITDERKRKEVEDKQRQVQQLEEELGLGKKERAERKDKTYNLLDIKEAVEIKTSDYSKTINTKEFQFVQKPRDGTANYTAEPTKRRHGKGLRTKYDLV